MPGLDEAAIYAWRDDNAGPPESIAEVISNFDLVQSMFPGATPIASTLDNFTRVLDTARDRLPIITQDLTDTWLMGAPSDPVRE